MRCAKLPWLSLNDARKNNFAICPTGLRAPNNYRRAPPSLGWQRGALLLLGAPMEKLKQKQKILFRAVPNHPNTGIPRLLENSNILYIILQVWIPHGGAQGYPKLLLRCMPKHAKIGSPRLLQKETSFGVCLKVSKLFKRNQNRFLKPSKQTR